jgi:hypothetical protein
MRPIRLFVMLAAALSAADLPPLRPPAVPLITHDPYFSVWSTTDELTASPTRHWTGSEQPLTGWLNVDGTTYRFLGATPRWVEPLSALRQTSMRVTPTRSLYTFEGAGIRLSITFLTPALPHDLEILARPVTYLIWSVQSVDGRAHRVKLYFDASAALAVDRPDQLAMWSRHKAGDLEVARIGAVEQRMLTRSGDDLRIDWGYFYLAVPPGPGVARTAGTRARYRPQYAKTLDLPPSKDLEPADFGTRDTPLIAASIDLGSVASEAQSSYFILAYDDLYSIEFLQRKLRPYWRRKGFGIEELLTAAHRDFAPLARRSEQFDEELTADLVKAGGPRYAAVAVLAYRQAIAAHKLVRDIDNRPLHFSKENFSNGCIATVDVTYPGAPLFLLLQPRLIRAQLDPIFIYASTGRWPWPYAPHDLGQYPLANGQVYGGGEENEDRQMPVEESGNMIILVAALAKAEGNAEYARQWWPLLTKWAQYLREKGMDPDNQLNTDDFAGHSAHNANLSLKAIVALAAYASLAEDIGDAKTAGEYRKLAESMAAQWKRMAADGGHYRLTFDKPGSWSQKYNLVWDKLLGLRLFDPEIARAETAFYKTRQLKYGLPLDSRSEYTKLDWIFWTATLASAQSDFEALTNPVFDFLNETPDRVPMTDWYWTTTGKQRGFQARSVVGGVFIKMLEDEAVWRRWASRK